MNVLEQVQQMKDEGKSEKEIITALQGQKIPPKQIVDALEQSEIKKAVAGEQSQNQGAPTPSSIPNPTPKTENLTLPERAPSPQGMQAYSQPQAPQQTQEEYYEPSSTPSNQDNYNYDEYATYDGGYEQPEETSTDLIIDIAEQVYNAKTKKASKKLDALTEFRSLSEIKLKDIEERVKRIEKIMDELQIKIIDKVGSYGTNLELIKKEMAMIEESFGKLVSKKKTTRKTTIKKKK